MDFVASGYVVAAFLLVLGLAHLWVASQPLLAGKEESAKRNWLRKALSVRAFILLFGIFYIVLSFLFVFISLGNSLFLTYDAPCENLLQNQTVSGNLTVYKYADSCATLQPPNTVQRLYTILGWTWALQLILLSIAMFVGVVVWMIKW